MAFVGQPPPQTKTIDFLSLVASADPRFRDPQVVYEYPNGRKFKEFPDSTVQQLYLADDGVSLYIPSGSAPGVNFYQRT